MADVRWRLRRRLGQSASITFPFPRGLEPAVHGLRLGMLLQGIVSVLGSARASGFLAQYADQSDPAPYEEAYKQKKKQCGHGEVQHRPGVLHARVGYVRER